MYNLYRWRTYCKFIYLKSFQIIIKIKSNKQSEYINFKFLGQERKRFSTAITVNIKYVTYLISKTDLQPTFIINVDLKIFNLYYPRDDKTYEMSTIMFKTNKLNTLILQKIYIEINLDFLIFTYTFFQKH